MAKVACKITRRGVISGTVSGTETHEAASKLDFRFAARDRACFWQG